MKTAILTDTNSGISSKEAESLGIFSIPMPVIIDGREYFEDENLTRDEFMQALVEKKDVTTSMPSLGDVLDTWDRILDQGYDEIVYIPMSSTLSSSLSSAKSYLDEDSYKGRVFLVDNQRISVTQRISVLDAKRLADEGKSGSEIEEILVRTKKDAVVYLGVDTLEYFMKGGRAKQTAASLVSNILNVKPILKTDGDKFEPVTAVRGKKKCGVKLMEYLRYEIETRFPEAGKEELILATAGSFVENKDAEDWYATVKEQFPQYEIFYNHLSCSICCHTGPNSFGVSVMRRCHI
ncbi:MAG: DegV family protein [Lachnospiraceae bacterium]|nr:DegV family protein [Lachnospiraceae bacterium]